MHPLGVGGSHAVLVWGRTMGRILAVIACGLTVAACSASMPSLNFFSSSPSTESVRFESEPPGAEVKTSAGQSCRTPCELAVQAAPELSATFTLGGYQPQTVSVRPEGGGTFSSPHLAPNPVFVELRAAAPAPAKKHLKKKPAAVTAKVSSPVASAAPSAPPAAAAPTAAPGAEAAPSATSYPWPEPPK